MKSESLSSSSRKPLEHHLLVLDGLRGLAIILVILYHYLPFFSVGWIGVDLFFMLSGFLITGKLIESFNHKNYFLNFYKKRVLRIIPLYYLVLILFFWIMPIVTTSLVTSSFMELNQSQWVYWLFVVNIIDAFYGWPSNITLIHFWSLSCEMQFYLIWPLVIKLLYAKSKVFVFSSLLGLIVAAIIFRVYAFPLFPDSRLYRYVLLFSRFDVFAMGALLYLCYSNFKVRILSTYIKYMGWLVLVAIAFFSFHYNLSWHFTENIVSSIGYSLNALLWFSVMFSTLNNVWPLNKIFKIRCLIFLGKYSYGLYVYHLPIWILISKYFPLGYYNAEIVALLAFGVTLLISWLSFHFFEVRFLKLKIRN